MPTFPIFGPDKFIVFFFFDRFRVFIRKFLFRSFWKQKQISEITRNSEKKLKSIIKNGNLMKLKKKKTKMWKIWWRFVNSSPNLVQKYWFNNKPNEKFKEIIFVIKILWSVKECQKRVQNQLNIHASQSVCQFFVHFLL